MRKLYDFFADAHDWLENQSLSNVARFNFSSKPEVIRLNGDYPFSNTWYSYLARPGNMAAFAALLPLIASKEGIGYALACGVGCTINEIFSQDRL